ncbi:ribosome maturation factor RimP [Isachenkonia alkalipeptolytica]|uniref:Ribosome maturation factor RimP n=1 Tax=Isachenkonia alkalipeptolytica TaxID=2565777 RepID=A0AA43XIV5_9CLOT|nr:ribosome maturation factor RimP [Isachenkonia alkalipeptolytica]NBG87608.1 ribosome maturation factor RimP [Isachenkonia alkalipeptolytica]
MKRKEVEQRVESLVLSAVDEVFELVDVEYVKEGPHRYLRIYMDKEGGITLEDCQTISESVSEPLDKENFIDEAYFLEISSPGLDRPLKKDEDYHRFTGENIEVKLYESINGEKVYEGELLGLNHNTVEISLDKGDIVKIPKEKIAGAKLAVKL